MLDDINYICRWAMQQKCRKSQSSISSLRHLQNRWNTDRTNRRVRRVLCSTDAMIGSISSESVLVLQYLMSESNRQFKCPCGKTYKSYPALHTHIRRKHNGEAPGQLKLPHNKLPTRRGRPAVQMHKPQMQESLQELEALTLIELGIIKITEIVPDYKTMLPGNANATFQFPKSHKCLFKEQPADKLIASIRDFLLIFCQHFTVPLNEVMMRVYSLFLWSLQKEERPFDLSVINRFLSSGWKQQSTLRNLPYDSWYSNIVKESFIVLSKWLYLKGLTQQVLTSV